MLSTGTKGKAVSQGAEPTPGWIEVTHLEKDAVPFVLSCDRTEKQRLFGGEFFIIREKKQIHSGKLV